jgi:hypothetical protein
MGHPVSTQMALCGRSNAGAATAQLQMALRIVLAAGEPGALAAQDAPRSGPTRCSSLPLQVVQLVQRKMVRARLAPAGAAAAQLQMACRTVLAAGALEHLQLDLQPDQDLHSAAIRCHRWHGLSRGRRQKPDSPLQWRQLPAKHRRSGYHCHSCPSFA